MRDGRDTSDLTSDALIDLIVKTDVQTNTHISAKKSVLKKTFIYGPHCSCDEPLEEGRGGGSGQTEE